MLALVYRVFCLAGETMHGLHSPMGHTPGFLSKGICLQVLKAVRTARSTNVVLMHLVTATQASHRSLDAPLKAVHMQCCPTVSILYRPAEMLTWRAVERTYISFFN